MSTNYYWKYDKPEVPEIRLPSGEYVVCHPAVVPHDGTHIGKRFGTPEGCKFIFAIEPYILLKTIDQYLDRFHLNEKIVTDEYGRELTAKEFSVVVHDCISWQRHSIGERFC